jgi:drug/metabolite transporter (DMT)-like permease
MAAALGAALLFGVSTPAAKLLVPKAEPLMLGSVLYLGAGLGLSLLRGALRRQSREAPLRGSDLPLLLAITAAGAVLIMLGAAIVGLTGAALGGDAVGILCIAGACLGWALDNNLTSRLSLRDPVAIVQAKGLGGGAFSLGLAFMVGNALPSVGSLARGLLLGLVSYGASVVLAVHAMRLIGVAREAAFFATAPFIGALVSVAVFGRALRATGAGHHAGDARRHHPTGS